MRAGARVAAGAAGAHSATDQVYVAGAAVNCGATGIARAVCRPEPELHEGGAVNCDRLHNIRRPEALPRSAAASLTPAADVACLHNGCPVAKGLLQCFLWGSLGVRERPSSAAESLLQLIRGGTERLRHVLVTILSNI